MRSIRISHLFLARVFGVCEPNAGNALLSAFRTVAQQASTQGITWIASSGDSGALDCANDNPSSFELAVEAPASVPEVTGVGGTEFTENGGNYWSSSTDPDGGSTLFYIPEIAWNTSPSPDSPSASGGGASSFFPKPSWQGGLGVPSSDGVRDVPDLSLAASPAHDAYLIYTGGMLQSIGGTSASAPSFAGMVALLNQYEIAKDSQSTAGLGNINPRLYTLAFVAPQSFHDITTGGNAIWYSSGYTAGPGYDQVTGVGSVDAYNLVTSWDLGRSFSKVASVLSVQSEPSNEYVLPTATITLTVTVTSASGIAPTGSVSFSAPGLPLGSVVLTTSGASALAVFSLNVSQLPVFGAVVTVDYDGDANNYSSSASIGISVVALPQILGVSNAASGQKTFAPGEIAAAYGVQLAPLTATAGATPLPKILGDVTAMLGSTPVSLYYVSQNQINFQIPYDLPLGTMLLLQIYSAEGHTAWPITLQSAAPGIFVDSSGAPILYQSASRGEPVTIYITGQGPVSPQPADGALPDPGATPVPLQNVSVTVGSVDATSSITYSGVPSWSIGVTQINFTIPANVPPGLQPVVVTIGTVSSEAVPIQITP